MPNTERKEKFVVRKERQQDLLQYVETHCRRLLGSDTQVDEKGNIFFPIWREVRREQVVPEEFSLLSRTREREEVYLSRPLTTKRLYELTIHQITKDEGSVEAAIRSAEHTLETELKREKPQVRAVRERISELFDLFSDFSVVTDEQLEQAERETYRRLAKVGLDPQRIILEEKRKMANWLTKASGGKDSWKRRNDLITTMALEAANRRAVEREQGIGETTSKFVRIREALRFAREFSREILEEVVEKLEPQRMPAHSLFKYPERPPQNVGIVRGMLNTMTWQLEQPPVRNYRPAGLATGQILKKVVDLLNQDRREEIVERGLFGDARGILEEVLEKHKDIYPK